MTTKNKKQVCRDCTHKECFNYDHALDIGGCGVLMERKRKPKNTRILIHYYPCYGGYFESECKSLDCCEREHKCEQCNKPYILREA
jgi:hypothetical protein